MNGLASFTSCISFFKVKIVLMKNLLMSQAIQGQ